MAERPLTNKGIRRASPIPRRGRGRLTIENGTAFDAVAMLVDTSPPERRRGVYLRAHETGRITEIPRGSYLLQFRSGQYWQAEGTFCIVEGTWEFDDPFKFAERVVGDSIRFSVFEVTLQPVRGGTATTHSIPDSAFWPPKDSPPLNSPGRYE